MAIFNMPPELLLLVADNLSLGDLSSFRSTCYGVWSVLNQRFQKLCLQDVGELTALQWAAVRGHAELIELAISNGAEIDAPLRGKLRMTAVNEANWPDGHDIKHIFFLVNNSTKTEAKDSIIRTPLFLAACFGHVKAIKVLLNLGASMQCLGEMVTPAHISANRGDVDCLRAFICAGFDINARETGGRTILHAATNGEIETMRYILQLEGGMNLVNASDDAGSTPLHWLMISIATNRQKRLMVELLLQHGADIHARDDRGDTPVHLFAWMGWVDCSRVLIDAGFDFHFRGMSGRTLLHCAVEGGNKMMAYLLGQEGGRMIIEVEDDHRLTPLQYAFQSHSMEIVAILLLHGAAPFLGGVRQNREW